MPAVAVEEAEEEEEEPVEEEKKEEVRHSLLFPWPFNSLIRFDLSYFSNWYPYVAL